MTTPARVSPDGDGPWTLGPKDDAVPKIANENVPLAPTALAAPPAQWTYHMGLDGKLVRESAMGNKRTLDSGAHILNFDALMASKLAEERSAHAARSSIRLPAKRKTLFGQPWKRGSLVIFTIVYGCVVFGLLLLFMGVNLLDYGLFGEDECSTALDGCMGKCSSAATARASYDPYIFRFEYPAGDGSGTMQTDLLRCGASKDDWPCCQACESEAVACVKSDRDTSGKRERQPMKVAGAVVVSVLVPCFCCFLIWAVVRKKMHSEVWKCPAHGSWDVEMTFVCQNPELFRGYDDSHSRCLKLNTVRGKGGKFPTSSRCQGCEFLHADLNALGRFRCKACGEACAFYRDGLPTSLAD